MATAHAHSALRQYIDANQELPPDTVLGHLVWFTVNDKPYAWADIEKAFTDFDLDPRFLPLAINPADAFEKASKVAEGDKYTFGKHPARILVREASRDDHQIVRHLVREVQVGGTDRLQYTNVAELVFYRPKTVNNKIDHASAVIRTGYLAGITPEETASISQAIWRFEEAFARHRSYYDSARVRQIIRDYVKYLNGLRMKDSVYFVHNNRSEELHRLEQFAEAVGFSLSLWQIPDVKKKREEIIEAFQIEAEEELGGIVASIQKLRATRRNGIKLEAYQKVRTEYDLVMAKANEYSRTLRVNQDKTAGAAEVALEALAALGAEVMAAQMGEGTS